MSACRNRATKNRHISVPVLAVRLLFCVLNRAALTNNINLDLAGVFEVVFNFLTDILRKKDHLIVRDDIRLNHNTDFTAGLNREAAFHAFKGRGDLLKLFKALNVIFKVFTACAGPCSRDGVGGLNQAGNHGAGLHVAVVRLNGVDYRLALLILTGNVNADIYVRTFNFMIQRFANVVQQAGTACRWWGQAQAQRP